MLWSRIPLIITGSYGKAQRAVSNACASMVRIAQDNSRVDSGEMRGGWQMEVSGIEGVVFNTVAHTVYNEYGTIHMSAQPMLRPAIEQVEPEFQAELNGVYR